MKTRIVRLALVLAVAGSLRVSAQVPGMFPWWDNPIAQDLGLSDAQTKQIRSTVREFRDRILKANDAVEDAEADMKVQMNADPVDGHKAEAAIEKVVAARGELTRAVSQMSLKLRMILNTTQWLELQKRQPRPPEHDRMGPPPGRHGPGEGGRRGGPDRGGPGGPGGPPNPPGPPPPDQDDPHDRKGPPPNRPFDPWN